MLFIHLYDLPNFVDIGSRHVSFLLNIMVKNTFYFVVFRAPKIS